MNWLLNSNLSATETNRQDLIPFLYNPVSPEDNPFWRSRFLHKCTGIIECSSTTPEGFYIVSGLQEVPQNTPFQARPFRRWWLWLWLWLWQCAALLSILWIEMVLYKFQLLLLLLLLLLYLFDQSIFQKGFEGKMLVNTWTMILLQIFYELLKLDSKIISNITTVADVSHRWGDLQAGLSYPIHTQSSPKN